MLYCYHYADIIGIVYHLIVIIVRSWYFSYSTIEKGNLSCHASQVFDTLLLSQKYNNNNNNDDDDDDDDDKNIKQILAMNTNCANNNNNNNNSKNYNNKQ